MLGVDAILDLAQVIEHQACGDRAFEFLVVVTVSPKTNTVDP